MNLIANWQPNGNCRPWYWEKIAYKATLERTSFKFIHPFRHWGEHRNHRIFCLVCLVQMNDTWAFYSRVRDSWFKVAYALYITPLTHTFLYFIKNLKCCCIFIFHHDTLNELKSIYYTYGHMQCNSCFCCLYDGPQS